MKSNWCKLGLHDWEYLESIDKDQLRLNVIAELSNSRPAHLSYNGSTNHVSKRVCIRSGCNKIDDQITPEKERIKKKYYEEEERREKAEEILSLHDRHEIEERIANKDW